MSRLTAKELDAVLTALGFFLAGETDGFEPGVVEAAESAHDKLSKKAKAPGKGGLYPNTYSGMKAPKGKP